MNRRDFLNPRRMAKTASDCLQILDELQQFGESDTWQLGAPMSLLRFTRRAMATNFEFFFSFGLENAMEAAEEGLDEIDRLETQMTVYREHSDVISINQFAVTKSVSVESRLFELLQCADRIHQDTEGAFDISTGALSKAWGFFHRCGRVPSSAELAEVRQRVGMQHVVLNESARTVRFLRPGLEINLGSIGKGYALDRAASIIRDGWKINQALLHGGHSSVRALGSEPGSSLGWPVGVRDPWDHERRLGIVRLRNRAMGTSAATFQNLEHEGKRLGHVIDPRTGWPAQGIASATAIAPTAAEADALATAFFIMGVEKTKEYVAAHPEVSAILLAENEHTPFVLNLSSEEFKLSSGTGAANSAQ